MMPKVGTDLAYLFLWRRIGAFFRHQRTIMGPPLKDRKKSTHWNELRVHEW